ncbi:MAG: hypothetical protein ABUL60_16885 [Myxococcales bacterium]
MSEKGPSSGTPRSCFGAVSVTACIVLTGCGSADGPGSDAEALGSLEQRIVADGSWTRVVQAFPGGRPSNVALLTDGRILACSQEKRNTWYTLIPDSFGNYAGGSWVQVASSSQGRLFNPSFVLNDGRYVTCGGEYASVADGAATADTSACEIYDPVADSWRNTVDFPGDVEDTEAALLDDGTMLMLDHDSSAAAVLDPVSATWREVAPYSRNAIRNEGGAVELPDGSVLAGWRSFSRYVPSSDSWFPTAPTPGTASGAFLSTPTNNTLGEIGPILLLDGRVLVLGGSANNAFYTPPATATGTGSWQPVAGTPTSGSIQLNFGDSPACVEPTGNVLAAGSTDQNGAGTQGPPRFLEYQPGGDLWATVSDPNGTAINQAPNRVRLLVLPTGEIFVSGSTNGDVWLYNPAGSVRDDWRPTVTSISPPIFGKIRVDGIQLNGVSNGADLGDDGKMSTNYPLVRMQSALHGGASYARSFGFSSMTARPDAPGSFWFDASKYLRRGIIILPDTFFMNVVVNGLASTSFIEIPETSLDVGPAIVAALF